MANIEGRLVEFQASAGGMRRAAIQIETEIEWKAGTYLQSVNVSSIEQPIPITLYPGGLVLQTLSNLLYVSPPIPDHWQLGIRIKFWGPLGTGFNVPASAKKIGLLALGSSPEKLLPLIPLSLRQKAEVTLLADAPIDGLPIEVEAGPLSRKDEILDWADFVAVDIETPHTPTITKKLGLDSTMLTVNEIQVLFSGNMPCGGIAGCSVCQLQQARGKNLRLCEDGPVLRLKPDGSFGKLTA